MRDIDVNFLVVDHDEGVGVDHGSEIGVRIHLTQHIFDLHSNHDHPVRGTLFRSLFREAVRVGVLNVDDEAILTIFQQFVEIVHLGLSVLFEDLESMRLNLIG